MFNKLKKIIKLLKIHDYTIINNKIDNNSIFITEIYNYKLFIYSIPVIASLVGFLWDNDNLE